MKRMVQGMMVALVCGAAFLTGCSSKDGDKTVFLDDYEKNIANKIVGKWINVEEAGKAVPTNLKGVMTIESFSKGIIAHLSVVIRGLNAKRLKSLSRGILSRGQWQMVQ